MKKLFLTAAAALLVFSLSACGSNDSASDKSGDDAGKQEQSKKDDNSTAQADLTSFEFNLQQTIDHDYEPIRQVKAFAGKDEFVKEDVQAAGKAAADAADQLKKDLDSIEMPSSLDDQKDSLEKALDQLKTYFSKQSETAAKAQDAASQKDIDQIVNNLNEAGMDAYKNFTDQINKINKDLGLMKTSFDKVAM